MLVDEAHVTIPSETSTSHVIYARLVLTSSLIATLAGLAALDSLNPATFAGVALILILPSRRPALSALAFVAGAYAVVLAVGAGLFLGAGALGQEFAGGTVWVRRGALLLAAVILVVLGVRRLRTRHRAPVQLPDWFGPWTAAPLGVLATGADLPNAFPFFVAIERLAAAEVPSGTGLTVLALYALVYCLPCLLLLAAGVVWRERIATRLQRVYQRFGSGGPKPRSIPIAVSLWLLAAALAAVAVSL